MPIFISRFIFNTIS